MMATATTVVVKYGIIGVGMMGREHLINLHHLRNEAVAVVAIADPYIPSQQLALQLAHSFSWPLKVIILSSLLLCPKIFNF
jgi:predicted dehydrogenase